MSHIFISYSRKDLTFAQKIVDALADNDLDTWIDWKSIPKGEDWEQEIYRGIEEADAFLFLISTDSVISEPCNLEIAHAVKNGKRILPVFITNVDGKEVYSVTEKFIYKELEEEINRRNFIFCREEKDEFEKAVDEIQTTIHTDYEWLQYHRSLQVKALEWERNDKEVSFLLSGKELLDTEKFVLQNTGKDPLPTQQQRDFIQISKEGEELLQKKQTRLQRRIIIGLSVGLSVLIILSGIAWWQRNYALSAEATAVAEANAKATALVNEENARATAQAETIRAEEQAKIAFSRLLAIPAQSLYESDNPNQSLPVLLATESMKAFPLSDTAQILQTHTLAYPIGQRSDSNSNFSGLFSSDGKWILSNSDNSVRVWDATLKNEVLRINHTDIINTVAFHPNGKWIAFGSDDNTIQVWDVTTGKKISQMLHDDEVEEIAFSPDGKWIISGSRDNTARVWETETEIELSRITNGISIDAVAFSPNGEWAASGGCEKINTVYECDSGIVRVWEAISGKQIAQFSQSNRVHILAFSPDGSFILSGQGYSLKIWDIAKGDEILQVNLPGWLVAVVVSPDGKKIVTGGCANFTPISRPCLSGVAEVWDVTTGENIAQMVHDGLTRSVAFSPDSKFVASASLAKDDVRMWDAETGQEVVHIPHDEEVYSIAFSPDGNKLVSAGSTMISVWDIEDALNNTRVANDYHAGYRSPIAVSPDSKWVISERCDQRKQGFMIPICASSSAHVWAIDTGQEVSSVFHNEEVASVDFSSSGEYVVSGSKSGEIIVWEVSTGVEIAHMFNDDRITSIEFSPDNKWIVSASFDNTARVWDANNGIEIVRIVHGDVVEYATFSPDGNEILTGSRDGSVGIWESSTGREIARMYHDKPVRSGAFSAEGKWVLSGSDDGTARIWDASTGKEVTRITHKAEVNAVAFIPSSELAISASSDGTVRVWNFSTGDEIIRMVYENSVVSTAISVDGKWAVSGTSCGEGCGDPLYSGENQSVVSVWEIATGREIARTIYKGDSAIGAVAFSPDGKWVVASEFEELYPDKGEGSIHAWIYRPDDLIEYACKHLPRNLTYTEWKQYVGENFPYQITCDPDVYPNAIIPEDAQAYLDSR